MGVGVFRRKREREREIHRVYQEFRLSLGKSRKMIIFGSISTTLNVSNNI